MKPRKNRRFALTNPLVLCLLMLVLTTPLPARAALYDYTYTGPAFTTLVGDEFDTQGVVYRITVGFRYGDLTPASLGIALPVDFTISDGERSFTVAAVSADLNAGEYVTVDALNAAGLPLEWAVKHVEEVVARSNTWTLQAVSQGPQYQHSAWTGSFHEEGGRFYNEGYDYTTVLYPPYYDAGGWAREEVVPLPPSALLLGAGLIRLAWARRKKRMGK